MCDTARCVLFRAVCALRDERRVDSECFIRSRSASERVGWCCRVLASLGSKLAQMPTPPAVAHGRPELNEFNVRQPQQAEQEVSGSAA